MAFYSWQVAIMLFSLYPIYIYLDYSAPVTGGKNTKTKKNNHIDIASGRFAESISQVKVVKSFIQERRELKFFDHHISRMVKLNVPQSRFWHVRDVRRRLFLNFVFLAVYLYIFVSAVHGHFSVGQAVALILYAQQIRIPIFTISFLVDSTQKAISDSKDYFEVMKPEAGNC